MRSEWVVGLFNAAAVVSVVVCPEYWSVGTSALIGCVFMAGSLATIVVDTVLEEAQRNVKEESHGER